MPQLNVFYFQKVPLSCYIKIWL